MDYSGTNNKAILLLWVIWKIW